MTHDDAKNRGIDVAATADHQPYYGTFQGVANFYPPPPPQNLPLSQPVVGFPQPIPPPQQQHQPSYGGPRYYYQGYHALPVYAAAEGRQHPLPCCGLGLGWLLFITGFFIGGVPWYIGTFILLCIQMDYREKPGLIACTVASFIVIIALTLGVTQGDYDWDYDWLT
ncbi:hypothetical protein RIF29_40538 [Crotalaria pallida]|uniref:60S ribosomal protein L18a-like protein n=1 Tax=Crotalaria pallida TaxID=3830 RepID=A0AAN9E3D0_CROPI